MSVTIAIDGNHNLHRVMHVPVFQGMASNGIMTGGVFGTLSVIKDALEHFRATRCIVVWDGDHEPMNYRKTLYPAYKANRIPKTEEEQAAKNEYLSKWRQQKAYICSILPSLGVRSIQIPGAEGDDLLYLLASRFSGGDEMIVISEDMDLAQLVSESLSLYRPGREEVVNVENFKEVTGVGSPDDFLLKKAVVGDTSDGIQGVEGVGEKTACALLEEFPTRDLDKFLSSCSSHKSARGKKVGASGAVVRRNLSLMDLKKYPWPEDQVALVERILAQPSPRDQMHAMKLLNMLGFKSILDRFLSWFRPFTLLK